MVEAYGGCTTDQVWRRLGGLLGRRSACYLRVGRLVQRGRLTAARLPAVSGLGSGKHFLNVTPRGRRCLPRLPVQAAQAGTVRCPGRRRSLSPVLIAHHLAIGDTRVAVELACDQIGVRVLEWQTEACCRRVPLRVTDPASDLELVLVPDGRFMLALRDGATQRFVLEVDLGTASSARLRAKLRAYLLAGTAEIPAVLFIVPDPARRRRIGAYAMSEAARLDADSSIFWLTEAEMLTRSACLTDPIWRVAGGPEAAALIPSQARLDSS